MHPGDGPLLPPFLQAANLTDAVLGASNITVFAPVNSAFDGLTPPEGDALVAVCTPLRGLCLHLLLAALLCSALWGLPKQACCPAVSLVGREPWEGGAERRACSCLCSWCQGAASYSEQH